VSNPDFVEFHLSCRDLDEEIGAHLDHSYDLGLVVHCPDLFPGDHVLDLCAGAENDRRRSAGELERVIRFTRALKPFFKKASKPFVVVSPGGLSKDASLPLSARARLYERAAQSLSEINQEGVEVILQTLPPFPWYFGGQMFLNAFVDPDETARFARDQGFRLCLDVSHSKLACNLFGWSFGDFIEKTAPLAAHVHVADAKGVDGEGLAIGEGDIDFKTLARQLEKAAPRASFIPEIWQGHRNDGEGFWKALETLEGIF
jgi:N-acetylneuraminate synthase